MTITQTSFVGALPPLAGRPRRHAGAAGGGLPVGRRMGARPALRLRARPPPLRRRPCGAARDARRADAAFPRALLEFDHGAFGKPALVERAGLRFNLSHSQSMGLIAVCDERRGRRRRRAAAPHAGRRGAGRMPTSPMPSGARSARLAPERARPRLPHLLDAQGSLPQGDGHGPVGRHAQLRRRRRRPTRAKCRSPPPTAWCGSRLSSFDDVQGAVCAVARVLACERGGRRTAPACQSKARFTHDPDALRPGLAAAVRALPFAGTRQRRRGADLPAPRPGGGARATDCSACCPTGSRVRAWRCCASTTTAAATRPATTPTAISKAGGATSAPRTRNCGAAPAAARIIWLGARLGAALAVLAAKSGRCDPARLILWDPIIDGARYLETLRAGHVDALERSFCVPDPAWRRRLAKDGDAFTDELFGFGVSPLMRQQLRALGPDTAAAHRAARDRGARRSRRSHRPSMGGQGDSPPHAAAGLGVPASADLDLRSASQ